MEEPLPQEQTENELPELTFEQTRVLGALIEKELATPEYYPMTLNALVNACNQKNNRSPRVSFSEEQVSLAIDEMRLKGLVYRVDLVGSRVPKFQHHVEKTLDLIKPERALFAELLNRGPQTSGELRNRASRMFDFDGLSDVEETLAEMQDRGSPLVAEMDPAGHLDGHDLGTNGVPPVGIGSPVEEFVSSDVMGGRGRAVRHGAPVSSVTGSSGGTMAVGKPSGS